MLKTPRLQETIHLLEEGRGARVIKLTLAVLVFVGICVFYHTLCFKNFSSPEAMDAAQLARNIAEGKGYTTDYIRPFSLHLLRNHREDHDPQLKGEHPDLANPPLYPLLLAGLFKVVDVNFDIGRKTAFVSYVPERWIAGLNQGLFFGAVLLTYALGRRLFDPLVGWVSALALVGADLFWRFSISGHSTMLLLVLVLGVVWCLMVLDERQRIAGDAPQKMLGWSALLGLLTGLAVLTRYSFIWLIVPVVVSALLFAPRYRGQVVAMVSLVFFVVVTPWIVRNFVVSGTPFGTAGYAIFEQMPPFPDDTLQRSLRPEVPFNQLQLNDYPRKLLVNLRGVVETSLPKLGGSWVTALFLAGLLFPFRKPTLTRLRVFAVISLALFAVVQAWGKTSLSDSSQEVTSENLLVVFAPLVFIYGVGVFFVLLEQWQLSTVAVRPAVVVLFILVMGAPLIFTLLPPRSHPYAYPPYFPPLIQQMSHWMKDKELVMSDIPWAVAWYGDRQCSDLTLDYDKDFYAINDDLKAVQGLYLTPATLEQPFLSKLLRPTLKADKKIWERFMFELYSKGETPVGFPLKKSRLDFLPDHIFLTDWERWKLGGKNEAALKPQLPEEKLKESKPVETKPAVTQPEKK